MEIPGDARIDILTTKQDKEGLREELEEEKILSSLSTISIKSSNNETTAEDIATQATLGFLGKLCTNDVEDSKVELESPMDKKDASESKKPAHADDKITLERLEEYKAIRKEFRSFIFEVTLDIIDAILKMLDVIIFVGAGVFPGVVDEQKEYYYPIVIAFSIDVVIISACSAWRTREIHEMRFRMDHGYSLR